MITLADIVKHTLQQQPHQIHNHQKPHQEPTNHNPHKNPIIATVNHHRPENDSDKSTSGQVAENKHKGHASLPLHQLIALLHGSESVNRFQHRDHTSQVPERSDVDMDHQEEHEHDEPREKQQNWVLGINGHNEQHQETHKQEVVAHHQQRDPEESDEQPLEDFGNRGECVGERDGLWGVERGDYEDDGGGGEEREGEEEDEVEELEEEEERPFVVELVRVGGRALELIEEWVGEERVG